MDIYNMKPAWVAVMEETEETLGRKLTAEEIASIRNNTMNYANTLGTMYNNYYNITGNRPGDMGDEEKNNLLKSLS